MAESGRTGMVIARQESVSSGLSANFLAESVCIFEN